MSNFLKSMVTATMRVFLKIKIYFHIKNNYLNKMDTNKDNDKKLRCGICKRNLHYYNFLLNGRLDECCSFCRGHFDDWDIDITLEKKLYSSKTSSDDSESDSCGVYTDSSLESCQKYYPSDVSEDDNDITTDLESEDEEEVYYTPVSTLRNNYFLHCFKGNIDDVKPPPFKENHFTKFFAI